jgi:hypothetical protein
MAVGRAPNSVEGVIVMEQRGEEKDRVEVRVGVLEAKVESLEKRVDKGFEETKGAIERLDAKFDEKIGDLHKLIVRSAVAIVLFIIGSNLTGLLGG